MDECGYLNVALEAVCQERRNCNFLFYPNRTPDVVSGRRKADLAARVHDRNKTGAFKEFRENVFVKAPEIALCFRKIWLVFRQTNDFTDMRPETLLFISELPARYEYSCHKHNYRPVAGWTVELEM